MHAATLETLQRFVDEGELDVATVECQIRVTDRALAMEPVRIEVDTSPGARALAWVESTEGRETVPLDRDGLGLFTPSHCGSYCIFAQAVYAPPGLPETRSLPVEAHIEVGAPPVVIDLSPRALTGPPGSLARLRWAIRGAERAELRAPLRDETLDIPLRGVFEIDIDVVPETLQLVGIGFDGRERQVALSITPRCTRDDETLRAFMQQVVQPWRHS